MKKYVSIMAIMLCALIVNVKAINTGNEPVMSETTDCSCCKHCKSDKCKELCKQYNDMTPEAQKSEAGKNVKEECSNICKEECGKMHNDKCCSSSKKAACEGMGMEKKGCCSKK